MEKKEINPDEVSVHSILSEIKEGKLDPSSLSKEVRQLCVSALILEGHLPSTLAPLLKVSDKTVQRDLKEIREQNALKPSAELAKQLIGDFLQSSRTHHSHLMRLARTKEASVNEKVYAESTAAQTLRDTIKTLQSLGYLPSRPQEIVADLFHHKADDGDLTFDEVKKKIAEMEALISEFGTSSPEVISQIEQLKLKLQKAEIHQEVLRLSQPKKEDSK